MYKAQDKMAPVEETATVPPHRQAVCSRYSRYSETILLAAVLLTGLSLRLYRLDEQSFWWDEYALVGYLKVPSFSTYVALVRLYTPDYAPLPFFLLYPWSWIAGTSVFASRLLFALFSTAAIPLLFLLVRQTWGRRPAFFAALLLALSPMHVWYGQGAQSYAIMDFLAVASLYSLLRAVRGDRRWWIVHFAVDFCFMCTHLFAVCYLVCVFLYFLLFHNHKRTTILVWLIAHIAAIAVPAAFVANTLQYVPPEDYDHYTPPTMSQILVDYFGDDAVRLSIEFPFSNDTWKYMPDALHHLVMKTQSAFDVGLMIMTGVLIALVFLAFLADVRRMGVRSACHDPSVQTAALLFLIFFLPICQLVTISILWRPCLMGRYTIYSSTAAFALIGFFLSRYYSRWSVRLLACALLTAILFQLVSTLPANSRTNWIKAARMIRAAGTPQDVVFVKGLAPHAYDMFCTNMGPHDTVVVPVLNIQKFFSETAAFFDSPSDPPRYTWGVFEWPLVMYDDFKERFDRLLAPRGLAFDWNVFKGMQDLALVRVARVSPQPANTPVLQYESGLDHAALLEELKHAEPEAVSRALRQLTDTMGVVFPPSDFEICILSLCLVADGEYDLAAAVATNMVARQPDFPLSHFALAMSLGAKGEDAEALNEFEKSFLVDRAVLDVFRPLIEDLYKTHDFAAARAELEALRHGGFLFRSIEQLKAVREMPAGSAT